MAKEIYVLGIGHNTPVFIDLALDCGYKIIGLYHFSSTFSHVETYGFPLLGSFDDLFKSNIEGLSFMLTMGNMAIRKELSEKIIKCGGRIPSIIHPTCIVSRFSNISSCGVIICSHCNIQANSTIHDNTIILSDVTICHNSQIGEYCFIADGALIGAYTQIDDDVFWGQRTVGISGKVEHVGRGAVIGAMSLLNKNVPSKSLVYGVPAEVHKSNRTK